MNSETKNAFSPGVGFLFTPDGLSLEEMAVKLHEYGYITDEEMAQDGGVAALRRKLYDELYQNRDHYSEFRISPSRLTKEEKERLAQEEKLVADANEYAKALGVNDPKYMEIIVVPEDLEAFGIEVNGKNIVDAELVAKAIQSDRLAVEKNKARLSQTMMRIIEMVRWILAGRPVGGER